MREAAAQQSVVRYEAWRTEHPERALVVDQVWADVDRGVLQRPLCDDCGRPMHPTYDWEAMTMTGWRCRSSHR